MRTAKETTTRHPIWFHPRGDTMKLGEANSSHVTIEGPAAELKITSSASRILDFDVEWNIRHENYESSSGVRIFCSTEIDSAFGVTRGFEDGASHQNSHFIRFGRFLNVPCQGTSMDGDPNISIFITDEIQKAIRDLLEAATKRMSTQAT